VILAVRVAPESHADAVGFFSGIILQDGISRTLLQPVSLKHSIVVVAIAFRRANAETLVEVFHFCATRQR
jgi:hypothetical protein